MNLGDKFDFCIHFTQNPQSVLITNICELGWRSVFLSCAIVTVASLFWPLVCLSSVNYVLTYPMPAV